MIYATTDSLELAKTLAKTFNDNAAEADRKGAFPQTDAQVIKSSGILKLTLPEIYGGFGASLQETIEAQLELAKGSGSSALVVAMTHSIVGHERECLSWQKEIRDALFEKVANGSLINSSASEPRLGSPSRGGLPDSYAQQDGDQLIINGHKNWVTGGEHLDQLLVKVRLEDAAVTVWIPANTEGVRWEKTWGESLSLRASDSHDLYLENVTVSKENILQETNSKPLIWFPMLMAATYLGIALGARDDIVQYAKERVPTALGKAIATLPKIQRQIGEMEVTLESARTYLLYVASLWQGQEDKRQALLPKIAAAKHLAVEAALEATDKALRIAGGAAIDKHLPFERYFRDVRAGIMHPPSGDTALEIVGRSSLGL
ncbi:MAG: acyl-CoA/acyl-ACP dehydrogenase [Trueperaceae bacterium]|nr:acyl-CoA/acyl-ACP dehydrogenase [Trueperaceae bacterium]